MSANAVTLLDITNRVLSRLRESEVQGVESNDYARLLCRLINDAKREVEDAFNWDALHQTIEVTLTPDEPTLSVMNGGDVTNQRTRIIEVYNQTEDDYLLKTTRDHIRRLAYDDATTQQSQYYSLDGYDSNQNIKLVVHPTPANADVLQITCYNPQDDLVDGNDVFTVPWIPIYLRAYYMAVRERGDDAGTSLPEIFDEYMKALGDAMAYEQRHKFEGSFDGDWFVP